MATYHVTLGDQGYLVDLASYRKLAGEQFAGKQAVGDRLYADLKDVAVWAQTDWRGGRGFQRWDVAHANRWRAGAGLDSLDEGQLASGPAAVPIAAWAPSPAASLVRGFVTYRAGLFWCTVASGTLTLWRGESESVTPTSYTRVDTAIGGLAAFADAVWVGSGASGNLYKWDASTATISTATTLAGAQGIPAMAVYVPSGTTRYLYLGVRFDSGGKVYQWDGTTATALLTLEGATPEHLFSFDGKLYVACADSGGGGLLYSFDGTNWRLVLQQSETWIQSGAAFGERYYLGSGRDNRVWAFNGRDLVEVFAGYSPHGSRIRGLVAAGGRLYAGAAASDSFRTLVASATGSDWHELRPDGLTGAAAGGLGVRHLGALNGTLYLAEELASGSGATVYKLALGSAYNPSGTLETVRFDASLPSVDKAWRRVVVTHAALASGQQVVVDYRLDGAPGWTSLLASGTVGATTSAATFPTSTVGRELQLRVTLASGGSSPVVVKAVLAEYALALDVRREWEFDVLLEGTASVPQRTLDGTPAPLTGAQLSAALWAAHGTKGTVAFVDLDGTSYRAYFAELRETVARLPHRDGWQTRARVRLVEA